MKSLAQSYIDRLRQTAPRKRSVTNRTIATDELVFSSRFLYFGNVVLQTKNVSSIQKFERADHELIEEPVLARVRLFQILAFILAAMFIAIAIVFGPIWLVIFALSALPCLWYAWQLRRILKSNQHYTNDFFVEVIMNSGRRHRFYAPTEETADNVVNLFINLISSDDTGTVFRLDQATNTVVIDETDRSITSTTLAADIRFETESDQELDAAAGTKA